MHASVIIPTYNRENILKKVLSYYACQVKPQDNFELIIIDDGSIDGTESLFSSLQAAGIEGRLNILKKYRGRIVKTKKGWYTADTCENVFLSNNELPVRYVKLKKSGRSIARNVGIGFSSYPLIIFADDDIFVEPEFLKKHMEAHIPDDTWVIMGKVVHTQDLDNPFYARWKLKDINTAFLSTGNASVLKSSLIRAGLFDENYTVYGWEDFDMGIHLKDNGLKSVKKGIYGYHYDPPGEFLNPEQIYNKEKERGLSAVYFYKTHSLRWVKRFTMIHNSVLKGIFMVLGFRNWFLPKKKITFLKGLLLLIIRYKGYFDGIEEGMKKPK